MWPAWFHAEMVRGLINLVHATWHKQDAVAREGMLVLCPDMPGLWDVGLFSWGTLIY